MAGISFDKIKGVYVNAPRKPDIPIRLKMKPDCDGRIMPAGYYKKPKQKADISEMKEIIENNACADTGAEVNLAGEALMRKMGLSEENLHQDGIQIKGAGGKPIPVLGFYPIAMSRDGEKLGNTRAVVYFAQGAARSYISLTSLKDLKAIPDDFPNGSVENANIQNDTNSVQDSVQSDEGEYLKEEISTKVTP